MAAETQSGFIVDGTHYEVPTIDEFTLDEAQVLYDYCKLTLEDFAIIEAEDVDEDLVRQINEKVRNPGFLRALLHIAYQRANPKLSAQKVKAAVGNAQLIENFVALNGPEDEADEEGDARPPSEESTKPPNESSTKTKPDSNENGGNGSGENSDEPEDPPARITTSGSVTSLPSARPNWVA